MEINIHINENNGNNNFKPLSEFSYTPKRELLKRFLGLSEDEIINWEENH